MVSCSLEADILVQGSYNKLSLHHSWMRHNQPIGINDFVIVHQDIQVYGPRTICNELNPIQLNFDVLQSLQKLRWSITCLDLPNLVSIAARLPWQEGSPCKLH